MANKDDLTRDILAIDAEAKVEGLTNAALTAMLKELKPAEDVIEPEVLSPFVIAKGKSLTSRKGILGPGADALAEYFSGEETFEKLKDNGFIVKRGK